MREKHCSNDPCFELQKSCECLMWSGEYRLSDQRLAQRHVLYLGELNGPQEVSWRETVDLFGQDDEAPQQVALFPEEHAPAQLTLVELPIVRLRLSEMPEQSPPKITAPPKG